jgi:hypothetical protein
MNSQSEQPPYAAAICPGPETRDAEAEHKVSDRKPLPLKTSEAVATKQPTLLDRFYYWVMSRT